MIHLFKRKKKTTFLQQPHEIRTIMPPIDLSFNDIAANIAAERQKHEIQEISSFKPFRTTREKQLYAKTD